MRKKIIQRGWPRGTVPWRGGGDDRRCPDLPDRLPVPWINGPGAKADGDFHSFRDGALESARARNCIVCGLPIEGDVFIAAQGGERATSGHGGHARCILLTLRRCPHMVQVVERGCVHPAFRYSGEGVGVVLPDDCDTDCWGDNDPVVEDAEPITLRELASFAALETERRRSNVA